MRGRWSVPLILVSSLGAFACDSSPAGEKSGANSEVAAKPDAAKPDAAKPDAAKPDAAKPDASAPAKPKSARELASKPKPHEAKRLQTHLLKLLNEGRALTKKGDYAGGMEKYRQALEVDANDVSALGEMGWAAFQAGELELAHRNTVQALKFVRDDNKRGMLLYNLGRIAEERTHFSDAIDFYESSLAVRANKTVEARLASVREIQNAQAIAGSAGGELEGPDRALLGAALEPLARDLGDLAAVCKVIEDQRCEDFTMADGEVCSCKPTLLATPGVDDSWGLIQLNEEFSNSQIAWFPAVKTDKGWTVFSEVLYAYNPGAFGIFETATLGASTVEALLGTGTQLVMKFDKSRLDRDMGLNEIETEDYSAMVVCARTEAGAHCSKALLTSYRLAREVEFPEEDAEPAADHAGLPSESGFTASVAFADGKLSVTWTDTKGGYAKQGDLWGAAGWILPAGEHVLSVLLGLPS